MIKSTMTEEKAETSQKSSHPVKLVMHEGRKFGVIFGEDKFIVTNDEFIHSIDDNADSVTLRGQYPDYKEKTYGVRELKSQAIGMLNLADFGHYWGIKDRVRSNYSLLRRSMREIGVSDKDMPDFGEKDLA